MIQRLEFVLETIASPDFGEYVRYEDHRAAVRELVEALQDMSSGWEYIRSTYGDLYGVGWDRAATKVRAAIAKHQEEKG